jgi:hypothetical protein
MFIKGANKRKQSCCRLIQTSSKLRTNTSTLVAAAEDKHNHTFCCSRKVKQTVQSQSSLPEHSHPGHCPSAGTYSGNAQHQRAAWVGSCFLAAELVCCPASWQFILHLLPARHGCARSARSMHGIDVQNMQRKCYWLARSVQHAKECKLGGRC